MGKLFRDEVIAARQGDWLAPVSLYGSPRLAWLTMGVVAVALGVAAFVGLASYTRKAALTGWLLPGAGIVRLAAPQASVVVEQHIKEAQTVQPGQLMFVLRPAYAALLDGAQGEVERSFAERQQVLEGAAAVQARLTRTRLAAVDRRLGALALERSQLDDELVAQQRRLGLAQGALERQRMLHAQRFIAESQVQAKEEEVLAVQAQVQALRRQLAALEREWAELDGERAGLPLQDAQAQSELARGRSQLVRERAEQAPQRQFSVRAPQAGVVSALLVQAGQSVAEGAPLASLMPTDPALSVQLLAPTSAIGFIRRGQAVRVRYDAFPFQRFGQHRATVTEVSPLPLSASDLKALPLPPGDLPGGNQPLYRVTARLDDDPGAAMPHALRPGMRLQADVMLETRRLIEWMFAPALGVAGRL